MDLSFMESQRKFVKHVVGNKLLIPAILAGMTGFYSIPLMRFFGRVLMQTMSGNELVEMLVINPLKTGVFFTMSTLSVYLLSVFAGGRKSIVDYVISSGFVGLYFFCVSFLLTFVSVFSSYMSQTNNLGQWYVVTVILLVIVCIFLCIFTVKYGMVAVSEASGFESFKSFIIWTFSFVPSLLVFIAWIKQ